jgi:hypothetical protein
MRHADRSRVDVHRPPRLRRYRHHHGHRGNNARTSLLPRRPTPQPDTNSGKVSPTFGPRRRMCRKWLRPWYSVNRDLDAQVGCYLRLVSNSVVVVRVAYLGASRGPHVMRDGKRPVRLRTSGTATFRPNTARDQGRRLTTIYWGSSGSPSSALIRTVELVPSPRVKLCSTAVRGLSRPRRYAVGPRPSVEQRARVVGLDPDPDVLAVARRKADATDAAVEWHVGMGDVLAESVGADSVDSVVSSLVLHQCPVAMKRGARVDVRGAAAGREAGDR